MNKTFTRFSFVALACTMALKVNAQSVTWSAPQPVAANSYGNEHPRIALSANDSPLILWGNVGSTNFSRWTGSAFATPVKLTPMGIQAFTGSWAGPDIASKGDTVYAVYKVKPEDTGGIYVRRSTDAGMTFSAPVRVDNIPGDQSRFPTITTDASGQPLVGFMRFNAGFTNAKWVVTRSMNWGATFMPDVLACSYNSEPVCDCCPGAVVSSGNKTAMLYRNNLSNKRTSWAGISTNGGASFPAGMEIDNTNWMVTGCPSSGTDGAIVGDTLYSAYMSGAGGTKVYYSRSAISTMQGGNAIPVTGMSTGITGQNFPRVAADGKTVAIVWPQTENNLPQVAMLFAPDVQKGFGAWEKIVTNTAGNYIVNADVAIKNGAIHVVWEDMATGTVMYRKGTFSTTAGVNQFSTDNEVTLAPIPANNVLQIALKRGVSEDCHVAIKDVAGRVCFQQDLSAPGSLFSISTGELPVGVYMLTLSAGGGSISKKFVVTH